MVSLFLVYDVWFKRAFPHSNWNEIEMSSAWQALEMRVKSVWNVKETSRGLHARDIYAEEDLLLHTISSRLHARVKHLTSAWHFSLISIAMWEGPKEFWELSTVTGKLHIKSLNSGFSNLKWRNQKMLECSSIHISSISPQEGLNQSPPHTDMCVKLIHVV